MSRYIGDYGAGDVIDFKFTTFRPSTGASFTLAGTPVVSVYKDNSTTQSTTGVTLTVDFDAVTGLNHVRITTASDATFYADGSQFECVITTGTVDSVSVVGSCIGRFTLRDQACLYPTTAGRKLDVSATGEAGIDWANVGSPTTTVGLTGTTIATSQVVASVSGAVGSVTGSVGSVTGSVGSVTGAVGSVTSAVTVGTINSNVITAASIQADAITAAKIATGAIDADSLATDAVNEIADGILLRSLATAAAANNITITSIVANVFQAVNTLVVDDRIAFVGTAPASMALGAVYWVVSNSLSSTTFTISTVQGGTPIATSSTGAFTATKVTGRDVLSAMRAIRNKSVISSGVLTVYQEDDTAAAWTASVGSDPSANPIISIDPV